MDWQLVANVAQSLAIIVMIVTFVITFRHQLRASRAQTFIQLTSAYDEIARLRANNPDVLSLGESWEPEKLGEMYSGSPESEKWARYYSYAELCIGFCTTCLYLRRARMIPEKTYKDFSQGLVGLLVTENTPLFRHLADLPFCSETFRSLMSEWEPGW